MRACRAEDLRAPLRKRLERLHLEAKLSALPPVVLGGMLWSYRAV